MRIDLHVHSTASDGTLTPAEVVHAAAAAGVSVLGLSDHDTLAGVPAARRALPPGLTLVPGVELSCAARVGERRIAVHLLGYLVDPAEPNLAAELARLRADRERRARLMVERAQAAGAQLSWASVAGIAAGAPVGRPHVARALVEAGAVESYAAAFGPDWLAPGGRAYAGKYAVPPAEGVRLIRGAGGVAVLAHPGGFRPVPDWLVAELAGAGLFGLEVDHPEHDQPARVRLRRLAAELGLTGTGSSDFHGTVKPQRIGADSTDPAAYEALLTAATGDRPVTG